MGGRAVSVFVRAEETPKHCNLHDLSHYARIIMTHLTLQ